MRGVFFCPSYSPPRPQKASEKKLRLENAWCFFCPLRFPTTSARRHLEKSRREKSCADPRGFADFYQRFFYRRFYNRFERCQSAPGRTEGPVRSAKSSTPGVNYGSARHSRRLFSPRADE